MKKSRKNKIIQIGWIFMKVDVQRFGCNSLLQEFKYMKSVIKIAK